MKNLKLFPKTFIYLTSLLLVTVLIVLSLIYFLMPVYYLNQKKTNIQKDTAALIALLESVPEDEYSARINGFRKNADMIVMLSKLTNDNKQSWQLFTNDPEVNGTVQQFFVNSDGFSVAFGPVLQGDNFVIEKTFESTQKNQYGLKTIVTLEPVSEAMDVIISLLPIVLIISIVISTLFAIIYSKAISNPIKKISDVARRMEGLDRSLLCPVTTCDEIGMLAEDINLLYTNLLGTIDTLEKEITKVGEAEQLKVDFLRTASHELKTPITAASAMLEGMICNVGRYKDRDTYLIECKKQIDELGILIKEILYTSKLDLLTPQENKEDVDLRQLIQTVTEQYLLIAKAKKVQLSFNPSGSFNVQISKELFTRVLSNVISNAVNYTDENKSVRIYFDKRNIVIENECLPVNERILAHLSEPFYRPEFDHNHSTGGNGLGLYITNKILCICNIQFTFTAMDNGSGMRFIIRF